MWICLNNAFISAVQHRNEPDNLMVRARRKEHLAAALPGYEIEETPRADYRYRTVISKEAFKREINSQIDMIDYDNFKNSVKDNDLHDAYSSTWGVMYQLQSH